MLFKSRRASLFMIGIVALSFICIAVSDYFPSKVVTTNCLSHCSYCWEPTNQNMTKPICVQCSDGYFFDIDYISLSLVDYTVCKGPSDFKMGRLIKGYGRLCADCGKHNYVGFDLLCHSCPPGCDTCNSHHDGTCDICYQGPEIFDKYILNNGVCTCSNGEAQVFDGYCKCNSNDLYINKTTYECVICNECTRNIAKCKFSPLAQISDGKWDNDDADCPQDCHPSCVKCNGPASTDCIKDPTNGDAILLCKNDLLWEAIVSAPEIKECHCVCNANMVYYDSVPQCICEYPRIKTDTCAEEYLKLNARDCNNLIAQNSRYQCLCPPSYVEGNRLKNGTIPCVPRNCHPSCAKCNGPALTDCIKDPTYGDAILVCKNDLLWEAIVSAPEIKECHCVCHANMVYYDSVPQCICEYPRIKTDTCTEDYLKLNVRDCNNSIAQNSKYQCICPPTYVDGNRLKNGTIPCVPGKYVLVNSFDGANTYFFIGSVYYTLNSQKQYNGPYSISNLGAWSTGIDAAFKYNSTHAYMFKRGEYALFNIGKKTLDGDYQKISNLLNDLTVASIDAAFLDSSGSIIYMFMGSLVRKYNSQSFALISETLIEKEFPGMDWRQGVDSASPTGNSIVFTKWYQTLTYDNYNKRVSSGVASITSTWAGLPSI